MVLTVSQAPARSRVTTFFRLLLAIPLYLVATLWGIGAFLGAIGAWFAIVFTGTYPEGIFNFVSGYVRFGARVSLYTFLAVDPYPPFSGGPDDYAVQLAIPYQGQYDRLKTLLRIFYVIPAYIVGVICEYVGFVVGFVSWLVIVITGNQPAGLQSAIIALYGWQIRLNGLMMLVTESYDLQVQAA
jgi:hypothetical protein